MRELILSNTEKEFIVKSIVERKRVDGREAFDYRKCEIQFGTDRGNCFLELGKTKVMCQVSCEITPPRQSRPNEGILFVNVELSQMAAPYYEAGRQHEHTVEINRTLEKCLKESRCLDTESLCITVGVRVWTVRLDAHVLNNDGNIIDATCLCALAALAHFRYPDVTVCGDEITVHSVEERDPIPLSINHMPICVTFAFYTQGKYLVVDPTEREECVSEGMMIVGVNKHREICALKTTGHMLLTQEQVIRCSQMAGSKAKELTQLIQDALDSDARARAKRQTVGFAEMTRNRRKANVGPSLTLDVPPSSSSASQQIVKKEICDVDVVLSSDEPDIVILDKGAVQIGSGGRCTWDFDSDVEEIDPAVLQPDRTKPLPSSDAIEIDDTSEEEEIVVLHSSTGNASHKPQPSKPDTIDLTVALKNKQGPPKRKK